MHGDKRRKGGHMYMRVLHTPILPTISNFEEAKLTTIRVAVRHLLNIHK